MKKRAIIGLGAMLAATAMVFGGCGSDDETTLSKAEFTKQANAICVEGNERRKAEYRLKVQELEQKQKKSPGPPEQADLFLDVFIIPFGEMIEELEDLGVPEGDEKKVDKIFSEMRQGVEILEGDPTLVLGEPTMFDKANKLNAEYGLTGCVV